MVLKLHGKETPFEIWKALTDHFERRNDARKLALRDKHKRIRMQKNETILQYLSNITKFQDEPRGVGENVPSTKLVRLSLLGLPKS